jgi:beta-phosphoglucomutase-like phosphatase (HAD superfamily)
MKAASYFGADPKHCIVFEDAPNGVLAGKNAGMRVVAVPSVYVAGDPIFDTADLVLESLGDLL